MEPNTEDQENSTDTGKSPEISKNQRLFLKFSDFLIILVIIVDLLYVGDFMAIIPGDMLLINVVSVSISFVAYELKKRIRKINRRKRKALDESTSQEAQR
jgi:hypothetical protein